MKLSFYQYFLRWIPALVLVGLSLPAATQPAGLLYDPEPPADSAYVRTLHASRDGNVDVVVDGRVRVKKLASGEASDYMVLSAGKHTVSVHLAGKNQAVFTMSLDVVRGRAMTVAFTSLKTDTVPIIFEDKANSNKLKALLAVYHLDPNIGKLNIFTADGSTKVFTDLAYGSPAFIQVNPISIELIATKLADKVALTKTSLVMNQGGAYSILLLPGGGGKLISSAIQNKIERFTGN